MGRFAAILQSSIGAKIVMAATGVLLVLFIIAHLAGNLLVVAGPEATNAYAQGLKDLGVLLWLARAGLLAVLLVHVGSALRLWRLNRAARPEGYAVSASSAVTYAGRSIVLTGALVLAFAVYHLLHFTLFAVNPEFARLLDAQGRHDVYRMVVLGFGNAAVSGVYLASMVLLGLHLSHGVTSLFQSLGLSGSSGDSFIKRLGPWSGVLIALGFMSIPLAVLAGVVK